LLDLLQLSLHQHLQYACASALAGALIPVEVLHLGELMTNRLSNRGGFDGLHRALIEPLRIAISPLAFEQRCRMDQRGNTQICECFEVCVAYELPDGRDCQRSDRQQQRAQADRDVRLEQLGP
jgi:hypothetical protein